MLPLGDRILRTRRTSTQDISGRENGLDFVENFVVFDLGFGALAVCAGGTHEAGAGFAFEFYDDGGDVGGFGTADHDAAADLVEVGEGDVAGLVQGDGGLHAGAEGGPLCQAGVEVWVVRHHESGCLAGDWEGEVGFSWYRMGMVQKA